MKENAESEVAATPSSLHMQISIDTRFPISILEYEAA